jgi:transcription termination factor Rho
MYENDTKKQHEREEVMATSQSELLQAVPEQPQEDKQAVVTEKDKAELSAADAKHSSAPHATSPASPSGKDQHGHSQAPRAQRPIRHDKPRGHYHQSNQQQSAPHEPRQSNEGSERDTARNPQDNNQEWDRPQYNNRPRDRDNKDRNREPRDARDGYQHQPRSLEEYSLPELNVYARKFGIMGAAFMSKDQLLSKIRYVEAHPDIEMDVEGVLEKLPDGFGFLRAAVYDYVAGPDDVYVSPSQIRRFGLRTGDTVQGVIRKPKEGEKYFALLKVNTVNGLTPAQAYDRPAFDRLTPTHPNKKFVLEYEPTAIATRIMDLFAPIGRGQRGLIVAPPKVGKTLLMKEITQSLMTTYPDAKLIVLLIDERPEEVADMRRTVRGTSAQVVSSTFDEPAARHTQVAEVVLEQAKRLVESGKDVVILLDSLTRLARAYNTNAPASGKVLTGGIDAHALQWPKRFFGAARCTEEGGSLTIIASALVDTGSRMDEVIYEEFKGTGNMEIHMTRKLSNRRTYPAFDLPMSGTRRDDLLLTEEELNKVWMLQKLLSTMNTVDGMEFLIEKMKKFKTNREFLDSINKKTAEKNGTNGSTHTT